MLSNQYTVFYYSEQFIADVTTFFSTSRTVLTRLVMQGFVRSYRLILFKTLMSDLEA